MSYKIAIASSNGESVNQHFGQSKNFLIYQISKDGVIFLEDRSVAHEASDSRHDDQLPYLADQIQDCNAIFVLKIGMKASRYLYQRNIKSFQVNYSLNYILETLLKNERERNIKII